MIWKILTLHIFHQRVFLKLLEQPQALVGRGWIWHEPSECVRHSVRTEHNVCFLFLWRSFPSPSLPSPALDLHLHPEASTNTFCCMQFERARKFINMPRNNVGPWWKCVCFPVSLGGPEVPLHSSWFVLAISIWSKEWILCLNKMLKWEKCKQQT